MSDRLPETPIRFVVETCFHGGHWENCWTDENSEPSTFATRAEAQAEIDDVLADTAEAYAAGDVSDPHHQDDFRIVGARHD